MKSHSGEQLLDTSHLAITHLPAKGFSWSTGRRQILHKVLRKWRISTTPQPTATITLYIHLLFMIRKPSTQAAFGQYAVSFATKLSDALVAFVLYYVRWNARRDSPNMSLLEAFLPKREG